jgi:hypothetical protein
MSITYSWIITNVLCAVEENGLTNVVKTINWAYRGALGEVALETIGSVDVDPVDDPMTFIEFENLTTEMVTNWLLSKLDESIILFYQKDLADQINSIISPSLVTKQLLA